MNNDLFGLASSAGTPGGTDGDAADQPRRDSGDPAGRLAVRRAAGRVLRRRHQRGHQERHERHSTAPAFFFGRNQNWVGKGVDRHGDLARSRTSRAAAASAGRSCRTRRSSSARRIRARKQRPTGFSRRRAAASTFAAARRWSIGSSAILKNAYGYDEGPNPNGEFAEARPTATSIFVRGDFNLQRAHQLTIRHNYINGFNDISSRLDDGYRTPDALLPLTSSKTNSTVGQLNSHIRQGRERAAHRVHDACAIAASSPSATRRSRRSRCTLATGIDRRVGHASSSRRANAIDQDIMELTDAYTMIKGKHTLTIGTHNEFFEFQEPLHPRQLRHVLLHQPRQRSRQGWRSSTITASRRRAIRSRPRRSSVRQWGFYAGDQWRVQLEHDADLRRPLRRADVSRQAERQSGCRSPISATQPTWCRATSHGLPASGSTTT